ncbi:hypothetical protein, partial [Subtercola boreus]|uniref:hypothetical protein n=1 Tax=Subtercola boreus TaxID=120213 RepID=UPI001C0F0CCB
QLSKVPMLAVPKNGRGLRPRLWCSFPSSERWIIDVVSHRAMVSENRSKFLTEKTQTHDGS